MAQAKDASIEYDENGTDELIISSSAGGMDILIPEIPGGDNLALAIKDASNTYLSVYTAAGQQTVRVDYALTMMDDKRINFGSSQPDAFIVYNSGPNKLQVSSSANGIEISGALYLDALSTVSGAIAGAGSYLGLDSNRKIVLTASAAGGSTNAGGSDTQLQYNNGGTAFGGVASLTYNDSSGHLTVIDDKNLYFGSDNNASIIYDETTDNKFEVGSLEPTALSGARVEITGAVHIGDDSKLYFGVDNNAYIEYDENGANVLEISGTRIRVSASTVKINSDVQLGDDDKLYFGDNDDAYIQYDEGGGVDELIISSSAGGMDILVPEVPGGDNLAFTIKDASNTYMSIYTAAGQQTMRVDKALTMMDDVRINWGSASPDAHLVYSSGPDKIQLSGSPSGTELTGNIETTGSFTNRFNACHPGMLANNFGVGDVVTYGSGSNLSAGALYYLNQDGGWVSASAKVTASVSGKTGGSENRLLGLALGSNPAVAGMLIRGHFHALNLLLWIFCHRKRSLYRARVVRLYESIGAIRIKQFCENSWICCRWSRYYLF